jgi:hypothetical protein
VLAGDSAGCKGVNKGDHVGMKIKFDIFQNSISLYLSNHSTNHSILKIKILMD